MSVIKDTPRKKNQPLASRISRSVKVMETDRDRSACDFLLVMHSKCGSEYLVPFPSHHPCINAHVEISLGMF